ncbi:unnamed protein product [Pedinophyceae sp. YPF-701]|nr:unnamed protein product [Pedinophyceae sp. YPF-701]
MADGGSAAATPPNGEEQPNLSKDSPQSSSAGAPGSATPGSQSEQGSEAGKSSNEKDSDGSASEASQEAAKDAREAANAEQAGEQPQGGQRPSLEDTMAAAELSSDKLDPDAERMALGRVALSISRYSGPAKEEIARWLHNYNRLSPEHQALCDNIPAKAARARECVDANMGFLNHLLASMDSAESHLGGALEAAREYALATEGEGLDADSKAAAAAAAVSVGGGDDDERVRYMLRNLARDWSSEGAAERATCYDLCVQELCRLFPEPHRAPLASAPTRVLVPGAGLGRLPLELVARGFEAQGNEFSYMMLLAASFTLNQTETAEQFSIYPFVTCPLNNLNDGDQLRPVRIPDQLPSQMVAAGHGQGLLSMCAGDFVEVYGAPGMANMFDAVCTCFFLDTAHNVIEYMEVIRHCLRDGGYWVNVGPLLYHWADSGTPAPSGSDLSLELSLEEVLNVAKKLGFSELRRSSHQCRFNDNPRSMQHTVYDVSFFTMAKVPTGAAKAGPAGAAAGVAEGAAVGADAGRDAAAAAVASAAAGAHVADMSMLIAALETAQRQGNPALSGLSPASLESLASYLCKHAGKQGAPVLPGMSGAAEVPAGGEGGASMPLQTASTGLAALVYSQAIAQPQAMPQQPWQQQQQQQAQQQAQQQQALAAAAARNAPPAAQQHGAATSTAQRQRAQQLHQAVVRQMLQQGMQPPATPEGAPAGSLATLGPQLRYAEGQVRHLQALLSGPPGSLPPGTAPLMQQRLVAALSMQQALQSAIAQLSGGGGAAAGMPASSMAQSHSAALPASMPQRTAGIAASQPMGRPGADPQQAAWQRQQQQVILQLLQQAGGARTSGAMNAPAQGQYGGPATWGMSESMAQASMAQQAYGGMPRMSAQMPMAPAAGAAPRASVSSAGSLQQQAQLQQQLQQLRLQQQQAQLHQQQQRGSSQYSDYGQGHAGEFDYASQMTQGGPATSAWPRASAANPSYSSAAAARSQAMAMSMAMSTGMAAGGRGEPYGFAGGMSQDPMTSLGMSQAQDQYGSQAFRSPPVASQAMGGYSASARGTAPQSPSLSQPLSQPASSAAAPGHAMTSQGMSGFTGSLGFEGLAASLQAYANSHDAANDSSSNNTGHNHNGGGGSQAANKPGSSGSMSDAGRFDFGSGGLGPLGGLMGGSLFSSPLDSDRQ